MFMKLPSRYDFWQGDCLELMSRIPDGSVDMILCDLPYGTTACAWDSVIPFEPLWEQYKRIAKPNAAIVLTASQPFTTALIASNMSMFKYCWIWEKNLPTGFAFAKKQPMRAYEDIPVFYSAQPTYNKQPTPSKIKDRKLGGQQRRVASKKSESIGGLTNEDMIELKENVSPRNVLDIPCVPRATGTIHPTQKPVPLFEYLIKTYTHPGETVLINCAGSGTTAVAALNTGRGYICIEKDPEYYAKALDRLGRNL